MNKGIMILGPTATGKTQLAAHVAFRVKGEIISADSRQVYRGMDLGTGKDLHEYEVAGAQIPYHLINILDAGEQFDINNYYKQYEAILPGILSRNHIPVVCGGSGLYLQTIVEGSALSTVPGNDVLRTELEPLTDDEINKRYESIRYQVDELSQATTRKRRIRAIEIELWLRNNPMPERKPLDIAYTVFGVSLERKTVRDRISRRLVQRLDEGMIEEVQQLLDSGIPIENLKWYGLEYRWITQFLIGEVTRKEMEEGLEIAIHQFSKRQMTFFRKLEKSGWHIHWVDGTLPMDTKVNWTLEKAQLA
ncbi:MAG: tRNA (adenosine(37)-N6)-dimethylallyltransferase MiaA [Flavobacteriales bacterium]|nr:tRNA (adenosine(37)-N6)-dimethylallyltransferase MiaA [Flavobacteriales bacterium]